MRLVTLAQARAHLRSDTTDDDADLELKIEAASELVTDYLGDAVWADFDSTGPILDSAGDPINVLKRVQQAVLLTTAFLYRERDGSQEYAVDPQFGYGFGLPKGAMALLYSLRRPVVG